MIMFYVWDQFVGIVGIMVDFFSIGGLIVFSMVFEILFIDIILFDFWFIGGDNVVDFNLLMENDFRLENNNSVNFCNVKNGNDEIILLDVGIVL